MTDHRSSSVVLTAGCKVNLGLSITRRLENGYHELDSFFYPLSTPHDLLTVSRTGKQSMTFVCEDCAIDPKHNTLTSVYARLLAHVPDLPGIRVHLKKGIPLGAGLGGGSSDAAVLLNYLVTTFASDLPQAVTEQIAKETGADVPFFLNPKPCRVRGIGDVRIPATLDCFPCFLLLISPSLHIDTAWAYREYDQRNESAEPALTKKAFARNVHLSHVGDRQSFPWSFENDLEKVVLPFYPELLALKERLVRLGGRICGMSGSGASLYALFPPEDESLCRTAARALEASGHIITLTCLC